MSYVVSPLRIKFKTFLLQQNDVINFLKLANHIVFKRHYYIQ